ncbi:hypothetical protein DY218_18615 [Streptomyces triticagri]|uniref:Uncharacterized protein n=1 Tax=Streptomyces triticagri TaxID=2293568 RepID=A0A372M2M4_9ACTN|nr:hypothetical protein DY218_18615 [Streptomyces triticagri]
MRRLWIRGDCWFGCERTEVPVLWLGPLQWDGQHAPVYACSPCLARIQAQATRYFYQRRPAVVRPT